MRSVIKIGATGFAALILGAVFGWIAADKTWKHAFKSAEKDRLARMQARRSSRYTDYTN